jgi:CheY-like chemotaxis protein
MKTPLRVMLVESNPADAERVRLIFEEPGPPVELVVVTDGAQALAHLRHPPPAGAARPDLVLLDLGLPGQAGLMLLGELKRHAHLRAMPVVVLTAPADQAVIRRCYELGASCYVEKPAAEASFSESVRLIRDFWLQVPKLP